MIILNKFVDYTPITRPLPYGIDNPYYILKKFYVGTLKISYNLKNKLFYLCHYPSFIGGYWGYINMYYNDGYLLISMENSNNGTDFVFQAIKKILTNDTKEFLRSNLSLHVCVSLLVLIISVILFAIR